ncbi:MAG: hypothetical protein ACNYZH_09705, partial [Acidimicrobiia bacterium]
VPEPRHGTCLYQDHDDLVGKVRWAIDHREEAAQIATELAGTVQQYGWSKVGPQYDEVLEKL